jgi:flagellar hook-associated protein 2
MNTSNRISGLASGMDTESIIKKLMAANRVPLDKLKQKKQVLEWQRDDYRTLNAKILDFRNASFDMKLSSNYSAKKSSVDKETILSASPTSSAADGIYELEVQQLAKGGKSTSVGVVGATSLDNTMSQLRTVATTGPTLLRISGEKGTSTIVVNNSDKLSAFISNFNSQSTYTGVNVTYDQKMDHFFFTSVNTGKDAKVELSATDLTTNASDNAFLTDVLRLNVAPSGTGLIGETVTGAAYMTTPPPQPDVDKLIDGTLATTEVFRVTYKGQNYDFAVNNTAKIGTLIDSINASGLKTAYGVKAELDGNGKLTFTGIVSGENIAFSDQQPNAVDIVAKLGLPSVPTAGPTVAGTVAFTKQPPNFVDFNKKIAPAMTGTEDFKITYDTKLYTFKITSATSIGSLISELNGSDLGKKGVTARLDGTNGKLILTSPDNTKHLSFDDADSNAATGALQALGLAAGLVDGPDFTYDQTKDVGVDAIVLFNGVQGSYASNTMNIAGINFTAKTAALGTKVNVTVTQDIDTVYNKIKTFVDKYNELIDAVNNKIKEKKERKFQPLTDDQRTTMKDKDIESWEARAKMGTLANDPLLSGGLQQFRQALSNSITGLPSGNLKSLEDIGISTTLVVGKTVSGTSAENGKLFIDETKLKAAISTKSDQIMKLFNVDDGSSTTSAGDGIAVKLYDKAAALFQQITGKAGVLNSATSDYLMGRQMNDFDTQINATGKRLDDLENSYYKKFSSMESYLNKMNSQSAWLSQQFAAK